MHGHKTDGWRTLLGLVRGLGKRSHVRTPAARTYSAISTELGQAFISDGSGLGTWPISSFWDSIIPVVSLSPECVDGLRWEW